MLPEKVRLREVKMADLPIFFKHQRDPVAAEMAGFLSRDREHFMAHWKKILAEPSNTLRTILDDGEVVGNVVSFPEAGRMLIGYWIGREYWGRGIATRALQQFLRVVTERPLFAYVARHNVGSIRVLEKSGFSRIADERQESNQEESIEEFLFRLNEL